MSYTDDDVTAGAHAIDEAHVECYGRWDASPAQPAPALSPPRGVPPQPEWPPTLPPSSRVGE